MTITISPISPIKRLQYTSDERWLFGVFLNEKSIVDPTDIIPYKFPKIPNVITNIIITSYGISCNSYYGHANNKKLDIFKTIDELVDYIDGLS